MKPYVLSNFDNYMYVGSVLQMQQKSVCGTSLQVRYDQLELNQRQDNNAFEVVFDLYTIIALSHTSNLQ